VPRGPRERAEAERANASVRNQLAAAVQVLVDHPDHWALLADHPELAPQAVEEVMRHTPCLSNSMWSHRAEICCSVK
jgi:cytochrome P450